ncbi:hypothetical protein V6N13_109073 [Hibiscus sabdariffa]
MVLNVETASRLRVSVHEVGSTPFFHANMYLHLQVQQVHDESSITRQKRAAVPPTRIKSRCLVCPRRCRRSKGTHLLDRSASLYTLQHCH